MTLDTLKQFEPFFGKWQIAEKLGEGSYGAVYKIKSTDYNGKEYYSALKVISIPKDENELAEAELTCGSENNTREYFEDQLRKFETEIELMSEFKGRTNIVSYEDHEIIPRKDQIGFDVFVRMELLQDLRKVQRTNPQLLNNQIEIIRIGKDICKALEICMTHNIIHRDIKPGNIMRSKDGDYKLGDFGVARSLEGSASLTKVGTRSYMAPEVENAAAYDARADIYSLGMVLYELLNDNRAPFLPTGGQKVTAADQEMARDRRMRGEPFPLPGLADRRLGEVVNRACAFAPADRYQSASEMRMALEEVEKMMLGMAPAPIQPPPEVPDTDRKQKRKSKSGMLAGIGAVLAVLAVAISVGVIGMRQGWFAKEETMVADKSSQNRAEREDTKRQTDAQEPDEDSSAGDSSSQKGNSDEGSSDEDGSGDSGSEKGNSDEDSLNEDNLDEDSFDKEKERLFGKKGPADQDTKESRKDGKKEDDDDLFKGKGNQILGASTDQEIHRYKVVMDDVTWRDAFELSQEYENGYLAHIDSEEEFEAVVDAIKASGHENGFFWLGARRFNEEEDYYWVDTQGNPVGDSINGKSYWLDGEPSLAGTDGEPERYMNMFYVSGEDRYIWNDTANDIIAIISSYAGRVGYIVEIED